jgi:hypothetical protein
VTWSGYVEERKEYGIPVVIRFYCLEFDMLVIIFPPLIDRAFSTVLNFLILCSSTDRKF